MKLKLYCVLLLTGCSLTLRAQIPVTDAGVIAQQFEEIARFIEMINNQVKQIAILKDQLAQAEFVSRVLGDPSAYPTASGLDALLTGLQSAGSNVTRLVLIEQTIARQAEKYDGGGIFHVIGDTFQTHDGTTVHRDEATFKPHAALIQTVANRDAVERDVMERRQSLRAAIRDTVTALEAATTASEVQKLHGVLLAQTAELNTTDQELSFASQRVLIQEADARNDVQRQEAAAREEQAAEFFGSLDHLRQLLRPPTAPVRLGTGNH